MKPKKKLFNFHYSLHAATYLLLFIFTISILTAGALPAYAQDTSRRAVISSMEGSVLVQADGQAVAVPARRNMEIKSGDRIITGRDGTAEIRYDDGSISRIGPGSRVDITNLTRQGADGAETTVLSAQRGSIWNNTREVVQRNSRFEVNTPAAVAAVRGTNFLVRVQAADETLVRVYKGLVDLAPAADDPPEETDAENMLILPSPLPPGKGLPINPFQQATLTVAAPPTVPAPVDVMDVDEFEKENLVEDIPTAYVTVETAVKNILVERTSDKVQSEIKALAGLTKELELLAAKIAAETDAEKIALLQALQQQLESEVSNRQEVVRNVELERQALTQEKDKLTQLKEIIEVLTPEEIKSEAKTIRQEEKGRASERTEREQQIIGQEQAAAVSRQQAARQAAEAGIKEELEQASAQVVEEDVQRLAEEILTSIQLPSVPGPPADTPGGPPADTPGGPPADTPGGPPADTPGGPPADTPGGPPADTPGGPPGR